MNKETFPKKIADNVIMYSADPIIYVVKNFLSSYECEAFIAAAAGKLQQSTVIPIRNAEQYQLVHYKEGGEYKPHYDSFDFNTDEGKKNWEPGGQRMLTALAYLNDVEEGGGTGFPNLDVEIEAKKGDVLVFHNTPPDSNKIHPKSLHAGLPVIAGEKWAINLWFRERLRY